MVYIPSKKELKQIENLNKGYALIRDGLKLIKVNLLKRDSDIELQFYKMGKNFDKIIKRIHKLLEKQYIDKEFIDIVSKKSKGKGKRFDKNAKFSTKKKGKRNKKTKG